MGRTVLAEESIQSYIVQLLKNDKWTIGLIIGQLTTQKDYIVRLVRTPEPQEDDCSEEAEGEPSVKERRKSIKKPDCLANVDEKWLATHAVQVRRMLPGGMDVIGVFAAATPSMMQDAQNKLRQVLFSINKAVRKVEILHEECITERFLLQICSDTRKFTCKSIDVADPKSAFRPSELKIQGTGEKWIRLTCKLNFDLHISVSIDDQNHTFLKQIQSGIIPYCQNLQNGLATVDGMLRNKNEPLDPTQGEAKRGKGKDKGQTTPQLSYDIDYLVQQKNPVRENPVICDCGSSIVIRGCLHGRSYVASRATVGEGIQAMTSDLIRSICARCELLCEDIEVVEEDAVIKELYDTPVRVFGKLPGSHMQFCDYMFQDEKIEEVIERIKELLDVEVTEEAMDLACERVATEEDWTQAKQSPVVSEEESEPQSTVVDFAIRIGAAAAGVLAMLIAGASYLFQDNT